MISAPRLRRQVWLRAQQSQALNNADDVKEHEDYPLGYATSWWNADEVNEHLKDRNLPIWASLSVNRTELFRDIRETYAGTNDTLCDAFGIERGTTLYGRHYLFWRGGKPLCLIYEVFSPALQRYIGPCKVVPQ